MRTLSLVFVIASILSRAASIEVEALDVAVGSGARLWVSQKLLDYASRDLVPMLIEQLEDLDIPDISGEKDSIEYSFSNFRIGSISVDPSFTFVNGSGVYLSLAQITASISCDWSYREKIWPHVPYGDGTADIHVDSGTHATGTLLTGASGGKPTIQLSGLSVGVDLGKISIHGSLLSWLYDLLIDLVKGSIERSVSSSVEGAVKNFVSQDLQRILAGLNLVVPLPLKAPYDIADVDFSFLSLAAYPNHLTSNVRGEIVSKDAGYPAYPGQALPLPDSPPSEFANFMVSIQMNQYVLNSGAWLFWQRGLLAYTLTADQVPSSFPVQLQTDDFGLIAPNLPKLYPGLEMELVVSALHMPIITFDGVGQHQIKVSIPSSLAFSVVFANGSTAPAFSLGAPTNVSLLISVTTSFPQVVHGNLTLVSVTPLYVLSSQVGDIHISLISSLISLLLGDIVVPAANAILAGGFPIPVSGGVSVQDLQIVVADASIKVLTDLSYQSNTTHKEVEHSPFASQ